MAVIIVTVTVWCDSITQPVCQEPDKLKAVRYPQQWKGYHRVQPRVSKRYHQLWSSLHTLWWLTYEISPCSVTGPCIVWHCPYTVYHSPLVWWPFTVSTTSLCISCSTNKSSSSSSSSPSCRFLLFCLFSCPFSLNYWLSPGNGQPRSYKNTHFRC